MRLSLRHRPSSVQPGTLPPPDAGPAFVTNSADEEVVRPTASLGLLLAYALLLALSSVVAAPLPAGPGWAGPDGTALGMAVTVWAHPVVGAALWVRHGAAGLAACALIEGLALALGAGLAPLGGALATLTPPAPLALWTGPLLGSFANLGLAAVAGPWLRPLLVRDARSGDAALLSRGLRWGLRLALLQGLALLATHGITLALATAAAPGPTAESALTLHGSTPLWLTWAAATLAGPVLVAPVLLAVLSDDWPTGHKLKLLASCAVAVLAAMVVGHAVADRRQAQFEAAWRDAAAMLHDRLGRGLQDIEQALHALRGFEQAVGTFNRSGFESSTRSFLAAHPEVQAVALNLTVPPLQRAALERTAAAEYGTDIMLRGVGDARDSGPAVAVVVRHIEPIADNHPALGLNVHAEPAQRAAMEAASRTGQLSMTGRLQLQDATAAWGAIAFLPLTGGTAGGGSVDSTRGFISATLRYDMLLQRVTSPLRGSWLGDPVREAVAAGLSVRLRDLTATPASGELARTARADPADGAWPQPAPAWPWHWPKPMRLFDFSPLAQAQQVSFGQRDIRLEVQPNLDIWSERDRLTPLWAMLGTLGLAALLLSVELVLLDQGSVTAVQVRTRTQELTQSELMLTYALDLHHQQTDQLAALLKALPLGCAAFDAERRLIHVNPALHALVGLQQADGRPLAAFLQELAQAEAAGWARLEVPLPAQVAAARAVPSSTDDNIHRSDWSEAAVMDERQPRQFQAAVKDAPPRRLALRVLRFQDAPLSVLLLLEDITDQDRLARSKAQFLHNAAHEIRTPLTVITGYADLLGLLMPGVNARVQACTKGISSQAGAMNRLLSRMLDLAELEVTGEEGLRREPIDLQVLADQVVQAYAVPAGFLPPVVMPARSDGPAALTQGDATRLQRSLEHLLDNAYAFSPPPGAVVVEVDTTAEHAKLTVSDQGIGMTAEELAQAPDRFYRADTSGHRPGFGLGLSYVKQLVELHHGSLQLRSTPGAGTQATLRMPRRG